MGTAAMTMEVSKENVRVVQEVSKGKAVVQSPSQAPKFLQRLYADEERRRQRRQHSNAEGSQSSAYSTSTMGSSTNGDRRPPGLSYSASSTTSEPLDLDDFSSSESVASSSFSRSTSPASKTAFWHQQLSGNCSCGNGIPCGSWPQHTSYLSRSSPSTTHFTTNGHAQHQLHQHHHHSSPRHHHHHHTQPTYHLWHSPSDRQISPNQYQYSIPHLQPLALPPPSLDLPTSPGATSKSELSSTATTASSFLTTSSDENDQPNVRNAPLYDDTVQLPDNFAMVYPNIYRSSFPSKKHYAYLKSLGLKTVLTLVQDEYPQQNLEFFKEQGIQFHQIGIPGNKEPFVTIPDEKIRQALAIVLDARNHPLLIHCNKGKHRTGCLVGCLRKMQCWSSTAIFDEYRKFSFPKSRAMDQLFIELFQPDWECVDKDNLPSWCLGEDGGIPSRSKITESFKAKAVVAQKSESVSSASSRKSSTAVSTAASTTVTSSSSATTLSPKAIESPKSVCEDHSTPPVDW